MTRKLSLFAALLLTLSLQAQAQWLNQASGFAAASRGIFYISVPDANTAWATAYDGSGGGATIRDYTRTTNGGTTWSASTIAGTGLGLGMIQGIDASTAFAALYTAGGANQGVYKTTDGGAVWTRQATASFSAGASFTNAVHFFNANTGVVFGDPVSNEFEVYRTTDGGTTWTAIPGADLPNPLAATEYGLAGGVGFFGNTVWFGTYNARVLRSTDQGVTWTIATTGLATTNAISGFAFANANLGVARAFNNSTGAYTGTIRTTDGGATWSTVSTGNIGGIQPNQFAAIPGTTTFIASGAATGASGTAISFDGGATWTSVESAAQRTTIAFFSATIGYAGGFNINATTDGMFKWSGGALPVEFASFTGTATATGVRLAWTTASEKNNAGFDIERSSDNTVFSKVGYIAGNGTTTEQKSYSFTDTKAAGLSYYRLKQVDLDGKYAYSSVIEVNAGKIVSYKLDQNYPNPFNPQTTIAYQLPVSGFVSLKVFDLTGREVQTLVQGEKAAGSYVASFDAARLTSGVYFYKLQAGSFVETKKMMLVK